nr:hypothetical protein [Tanacetum cinerariifolium]
MYKEYLAKFWYSVKALENFKVSYLIPTSGIFGKVWVNTFRNAIGAHYLPYSSEYVAPPSIDVVRQWFPMIGYEEEVSVKGTLKMSLLSLSWRLLMAQVILCLGGVTSEERANLQLNSGMSAFNLNKPIFSASFIIHYESASRCDASADSTAKDDPGLYASNDFIPQQQDQTKSVSEGLETVLTQPITRKGASSIARQVEEEEAFSTIKLEDLAKLVSNVEPNFKDLNSHEDDHVITVDDDDINKEDVYTIPNVETEYTSIPKSSSLRKPFIESPNMYKEYLAKFWYSVKALENFKVSYSIPTGGIFGKVWVNTFRNAIGAHYLPYSREYVAPPSIDVVRQWFPMIGYEEEVLVKGTLKMSLLSLSGRRPASNGIPTSLGVTSEERANLQLNSDSTAKDDPGLYASNDFIPQQQDQTKSVSEGLETVLTQPITRKGASSIARQVEEEKAFSTIKLEDLAKLVSNVEPNFKDLDSHEDDHVITVDDDDINKEDVYTIPNIETEYTSIPKSLSLRSMVKSSRIKKVKKFNYVTKDGKRIYLTE